jgi:hypothetical protein
MPNDREHDWNWHERWPLIEEALPEPRGARQVMMDLSARAALCGYRMQDDGLNDHTPMDLVRIMAPVWESIDPIEHFVRNLGSAEPPVLSKRRGRAVFYYFMYGRHDLVAKAIQAKLEEIGRGHVKFWTGRHAPGSVNLYLIGIERIRAEEGGGL